MKLNNIIGTFISNVEYAYAESQGDFSFGCLMTDAEEILEEMCKDAGLNADKVYKLAKAKM